MGDRCLVGTCVRAFVVVGDGGENGVELEGMGVKSWKRGGDFWAWGGYQRSRTVRMHHGRLDMN